MGAVTLVDVAQRAGVSLATTSRVLNGSSRVPGADVAARVRTAAAELGYVPNAQAQALARSTTGLVGLVVHDIADPYFSAIAQGVQHAARTEGRQVLLASTERHRAVELDAVASFAAHRADAIVLAGSRSTGPHAPDGEDDAAEDGLSALLERYLGNGGRIAAIGQPLAGGHAVVPANVEASRDLAHRLVGLGHRRFAVLSGPAHQVTARHRADGFAGVVVGHGLADPVRVPGDFTRDGGHRAAEQLIDRLSLTAGDPEPVCVFAVNDVMAIGALAALRERGLTAPRDVALAGFDDIPTLRDHTPPMTTVRLPLAHLGERAVALALAADPAEQVIEHVPGVVVLRESTRRGPAS